MTLDGTQQLYRVSYLDKRPQGRNERPIAYRQRRDVRQYTSAMYTLEEAERLKTHYERGGLSDVEIVPVIA